MKIVKILPIVLVLFGKVFGQTEFCNLYRFINYEIVEWSDIESIHDDLFTNLYQNQLSLVDVNQDFINNDNFIINVFDITKKCTKKIECSFNFVEKQKFDWKKISGFSRDSKRIILAFYKDLCVFEKSKNDDYIFVKHYRLNHATDDLFITFDNDSLYYGSYNLLGNCISVIDLNTGINNTIIEPALGLNLLANLRPNKYCDMTNDFLAITKATDYEIEIFDKRNKLFQRISISKIGWNAISTNQIAKINNEDNIHKAFSLMENALTNKSRITFIRFISSNEFLVRYTLNNIENYIDIWTLNKQRQKFELMYQGLKNLNLWDKKDTMILNEYNFPIPFTSKAWSDIIFTNAEMIIPVYLPIINYIGMTKAAYSKQRNNFLIYNNPSLQLFFYKRIK